MDEGAELSCMFLINIKVGECLPQRKGINIKGIKSKGIKIKGIKSKMIKIKGIKSKGL